MKSSAFFFTAGFLIVVLAAGCGAKDKVDRERDPRDHEKTGSSGYQLQLQAATALWSRRADGVVVARAVLPAGSRIQADGRYTMDFPDYLDSDGQIKRPQSPFVSPVTVLSVPADSPVPAAEIPALNSTPGGLLVLQPSPDWP